MLRTVHVETACGFRSGGGPPFIVHGGGDYMPLAEQRRLFASRWRSLISELAVDGTRPCPMRRLTRRRGAET